MIIWRHGRWSAAFGSALLSLPLALSSAGVAQTPATPTSPPATRLLGTVTATSADTLTLKLETGAEVMIQLSSQTKMVRTAPGEKTLTGATVIHVTDLATGDRVLVRAAPGADPTHYSANVVIAMKQGDIAQVHAGQAQDWQKRGVAGVVKSIPADAASGSGSGGPTIVISAGQPAGALAIHVSPTTVFRRYAADSVNFADAKPSTLTAIHPGDQLRARGDRGPDGVTAEEVVSGSFRNIAGTVTSIDAASSSVTLLDLATKKPVTLHLTAETQMRKLPPMMAQMMAARGAAGGKPGSGAAPGAGARGAGGPGAPASGANGSAPRIRPSDSPEAGADASLPPGAGGGHPDPSAMLQRAPTIALADLKKGDALMIVASQAVDGAPATAITLIAGVEPLLESPSGAASQNLFSASWNLNGGGAEAAAQ